MRSDFNVEKKDLLVPPVPRDARGIEDLTVISIYTRHGRKVSKLNVYEEINFDFAVFDYRLDACFASPGK